MSALLRADLLRLRRRKDLWIISIAVLVIGGLTFLAGYRTDSTDPDWFQDEAAIRRDILQFSDFSGMTQAEIDAIVNDMVSQQLLGNEEELRRWNEQQQVTLQKYSLGQSVFTIVGSGVAPMLALVLIGSLALGDEFRFGTVRTSLLAASHRRRFLAARLISLFALTVGLFVALAALGVVLAVVLRLLGAEVASTTTPLDAGAALAWFGTLILATTTVVGLGVALTLFLRSGALPLLLILIAALVEIFLANLPIFAPGRFAAGVPQAFLGTNLRLLSARLGYDTHAVALAGNEVPTTVIDLPLVVVAGIVLAWLALFVVIADRRFERMDIVE
jgi:ABC-type transport system involved in multi-copper enzyme maturation permease subunit